jgi:CubicO group peptidase (beta-lactamase class C family)
MENRKAMIVRNIKTITVLLCVAFAFNACLKDSNENLAFKDFQPKEIGDGLILSNPTSENMNAQTLTGIFSDVYADENLWSMRSLLVFRNGKMVAESYLKDMEDITNKHLIWSCTKQVMGVLTGIAIDEGVIASINDPISIYLNEELSDHPDKEDITIRNLLTMQSGIGYDNGKQTDELLRQIPDNSLSFILNRPVVDPPGSKFYYNDGNPHLISAIIQKVVGKPTDEWADEVLFSKIGMTNYNWVRYKDGISLGGFGIETTPREIAKIALCVANNGRWNTEQIVSSTWISDLSTPQVSIVGSDYSFGYLWWLDSARGIHFMWGVGGQFAFVVPHKSLVVVITSYPNTAGEYEIQADEALAIVDMIVDTAE